MLDGSPTVALLMEHYLDSVVRGYYVFIGKDVSHMSSKNSKKMEHLWYEANEISTLVHTVWFTSA